MEFVLVNGQKDGVYCDGRIGLVILDSAIRPKKDRTNLTPCEIRSWNIWIYHGDSDAPERIMTIPRCLKVAPPTATVRDSESDGIMTGLPIAW